MKTLQKDLTTGNPGKIIFNFTLPIFIGNVFQQFYSMADTIIVGKFVGTKALAAVGSTGTIMFLINGFILGMTAGFTVLTAQKFGAGDMKAMRKTVGNAAILAIIMSLIMTVLGMMAMKPLLGIMKTPDDIFKDAYAYIMVICGGIAAQMLYNFLSSVLRALGNSKVPLYFLILAALLNIVLDMVFIIAFHMGAAGAAWATVLGQIASLALAAVFHFHLNRELPFRRKALRLRRSIVGEIYSIGVPAIIAQGAMSVMNYCVNLIFGSLDSSYVTAYGIVYKIQQFVLFAAFGLRDAITPIMSFSYGMQNAKRIREGVRCGLLYTSVLMLVCTAAVEILAQPLAGIFSLSAGTMGLCVTGLRVLAVSFVFAGANIAIQGVFQATEGGVQSLLVSLLRQLIFVLPAAWQFARLLPAGVWLAFPIAEVLTAVIAAVLLRHTAGKGRLSQQDHAASLSK